MKSLLLLLAVVLCAGCSTPHVGDYVGGENRCMVGSAYGCHLYVVNGYTVQGVGINLRMVGGEIGGGKPPSIENDM